MLISIWLLYSVRVLHSPGLWRVAIFITMLNTLPFREHSIMSTMLIKPIRRFVTNKIDPFSKMLTTRIKAWGKILLKSSGNFAKENNFFDSSRSWIPWKALYANQTWDKLWLFSDRIVKCLEKSGDKFLFSFRQRYNSCFFP